MGLGLHKVLGLVCIVSAMVLLGAGCSLGRAKALGQDSATPFVEAQKDTTAPATGADAKEGSLTGATSLPADQTTVASTAPVTLTSETIPQDAKALARLEKLFMKVDLSDAPEIGEAQPQAFEPRAHGELIYIHTKLREYDIKQLHVRLAQGRVVLRTAESRVAMEQKRAELGVSAVSKKKTKQPVGNPGLIHVHLSKGSPASCPVQIVFEPSKNLLRITDEAKSEANDKVTQAISALNKRIPSEAPCDYVVELQMDQPVDAVVELVRGDIDVETWKKSVEMKVAWGEIDVGGVTSLDVTCGRCTLAGERVKGPVHYAIDSGNVGLSGLTTTVEGKVNGDTVLKWAQVLPKTAVNLVSHAGDVILSFPGGVALAMNVKAPKGDVYTNQDPQHSGVPVQVVAELGNIRLYRNTAK